MKLMMGDTIKKDAWKQRQKKEDEDNSQMEEIKTAERIEEDLTLRTDFVLKDNNRD